MRKNLFVLIVGLSVGSDELRLEFLNATAIDTNLNVMLRLIKSR
jgi:hypothetical protein